MIPVFTSKKEVLIKKEFSQWEGFNGKRWKEKIDVRNFIK